MVHRKYVISEAEIAEYHFQTKLSALDTEHALMVLLGNKVGCTHKWDPQFDLNGVIEQAKRYLKCSICRQTYNDEYLTHEFEFINPRREKFLHQVIHLINRIKVLQ